MLLPICSPLAFSACTFTVFYLAATAWVRRTSYRDPGSFFFDAARAYTPQYSAVRLQQGEDYLSHVDLRAPFTRNATQHASPTPDLCVGVVSVAREGVDYLRTAVASLLEGLSASERERIHLLVFVPHTDPTVHPVFHSSWPSKLVDQLLVYNFSDPATPERKHVKELEQGKEGIRAKIMLDYMYMMNACHATGAPYIALLEDDTLAMDGWFHRIMSSLAEADKRTRAARGQQEEFLYLRLFYTEEFLGWNSEDLLLHILYCLLAIALLVLSLYALRTCGALKLKRYIPPRVILVAACVYAPLIIVLFFAAGRNSTLPLPFGIHEMPRYGCCAQGLVWPRPKAAAIMDWYRAERPYGFGDVLIEAYANERAEVRWALTPSVIQHIGRKTSKEDDYGPSSKYHMNVAQKLWSFGFEMQDAEVLRREHERVITLTERQPA